MSFLLLTFYLRIKKKKDSSNMFLKRKYPKNGVLNI